MGCASVIPGDAARFDPVDALPAIRAHLGDGYELIGFEASGIRSDGTVDITDERAKGRSNTSFREVYAYYLFGRMVAAPPDAPPVGLGGSVDGSWHQYAVVLVERPGFQGWDAVYLTGDINVRWSRGLLVVERKSRPGTHVRGVPDPRCTGAELFRAAVHRGVPEHAFAEIQYSPLCGAKSEPRYSFVVRGTDLRFSFDASCRPLPAYEYCDQIQTPLLPF
jgi:hypothetical protein